MEEIKPSPIQNIEDLAAFLKQRNAKKTELNEEIKALKNKFKEEIKEYNEIILFSISFKETIVFLEKQYKENFYKYLDYPETGLSLNAIEIIHREYESDIQIKYCNEIIVKFKFNEKGFNRPISLNGLVFHDEWNRIVEHTVGLGFNPSFASGDKYLEVKDSIMEVMEKIKNAK